MIDLVIFILVSFGLFAAFIAAIEYYWYVGPIAGLFGAVFTLELWNMGPVVIIRAFLDSSGELVYQTMDLGLFFYVPLILSALCFAAALKQKGR